MHISGWYYNYRKRGFGNLCMVGSSLRCGNERALWLEKSLSDFPQQPFSVNTKASIFNASNPSKVSQLSTWIPDHSHTHTHTDILALWGPTSLSESTDRQTDEGLDFLKDDNKIIQIERCQNWFGFLLDFGNSYKLCSLCACSFSAIWNKFL